MRKQSAKGSDEYNKYQNLINQAYGVQKRYAVKEEKAETLKPSTVPTKKTEPQLATRTKPAASKPAAKKPVSKTTTSGGSGMGSVNQKQMSDFIEEDKSISFDSPSKSRKENRQAKRTKRKTRRQAVKNVRRSMKEAGGLKDRRR